jgi:hypothetical protein
MEVWDETIIIENQFFLWNMNKTSLLAVNEYAIVIDDPASSRERLVHQFWMKNQEVYHEDQTHQPPPSTKSSSFHLSGA